MTSCQHSCIIYAVIIPNAGAMPAMNVGHRRRRQANINPALVQSNCRSCYATSAHYWPDNVSMYRALVRCWAIVYEAGQHLNGIGVVWACILCVSQHKVLPSVEWILARANYGRPALKQTFNDRRSMKPLLLCLPSLKVETYSFTSHRSCCLCVSVCECAGGQTQHAHPMLG